MTATTLIRDLADKGVTLATDGERLHVEAKPGTVTAELRDLLAKNKAELVTALVAGADVRARLLRLADLYGYTTTLVDRVPSQDLPAFREMSDAYLAAMLDSLQEDADMEAGRVPTGWTAKALCHHCGTVWLPPSIARLLDVKDGWPYAPMGCRWCHARKQGVRLPRPRIASDTCTHWHADKINPPAGRGQCACGSFWPGQRHTCDQYQPRAKP